MSEILFSDFSGAKAILVLLSVSLVYLFSIAIYRIFFHPLAKYPGPFLGKLTEWNTLWPSLRGESTRQRHAWTMKYGDVVRIGPDELLFGDLQSVKDIYGQTSSVCIKDPGFYGPFTVTGARNVFNSYDRGEHARIRRLLSNPFSMTEIKKTQKRVIPIIQKCLDVIETSQQPVNLFEPFNRLFLDIVSELSFDQSFNCLAGELLQEAHDADALQNISALKGMFPLIEWVPTEFVQAAVKARPRLIHFARQRIEEFRTRLHHGTVREGSILRRVVENKNAEDERAFSDLELAENAIVFIQAGSETSLSTILYLLYEVDRNPAIKQRLVQEVLDACPDTTTFPNFDTIENLPFLNKVLDETLRLRGPIPVNLPRLSPGKVIGGHYVPAGIRVCNLAYTTHRNPKVFPEPESFNPDRWDAPTPEMKISFRPFSTGPRNCIGLHLAKMQILLTVAAVYQQYEIQLDPKTTEEMMVAQDRGVMSPRGKKVLFHFRRRL